MTKISSKWHSQKMDIANQIGEISSLWMCGLRERNKAFENGIKSWHDPRACSRLFGIKGDRGKIIDKMININKQNIINMMNNICITSIICILNNVNIIYIINIVTLFKRNYN